MAGGSPSTPFWTTNGVVSVPNSQENPKDSQEGAAPPTLSTQWPQTSNIDTDSPLLGNRQGMQGACLTTAMSSRGPSACNSPYGIPMGLARRPQLQTSASLISSPIPITGRLPGPSTAPAFYGHRSTISPPMSSLPAIEVSTDWLSAGAQPLMISAPWRNHEETTTHRDLEGFPCTKSGTPSLATPESSTTAPLDIGPFEMDPVIPADPSHTAGTDRSVSTQERFSETLPWQTSAEPSYSQGAEQSLEPFAWLYNFLTTLDAQTLTPASGTHPIAASTSLPSENGSVYHPSPVSSPPQDPDMVKRLYQAHFDTSKFPAAINGAHLLAPQDPLSVLTTDPAHLPNISKRPSEDVVPFIDGPRVAPVVRSVRSTSGMQYPSSRPSYSPYQRPDSSSPLHRRLHLRQLSGSDASLPSSILSPHDSGIYLSPRQLHTRTDSFSSIYTPGPPSVSSSVGSHSRENSLVFGDPQNYEMHGSFFPFAPSPVMHPGADNGLDGDLSANSLRLVIPTNPIQLPQPLPVPQIRHSVPYAMSAPTAVPNWYPKAHQTKEGKLQIDHAMINASFRDPNDPQSAQRRSVLERVLQSIWFRSHELEPKVSGPYDELTGGLGVGGRSVYTCFLKFMTSQEGNGRGSAGSGGKWVCLFGNEAHPCPKARWEEGFNKPERAIEHIRSHLGHRPFWCNNECGSNPPCTWKFFANSHRYDHWKKPHKRSHCEVWPRTSFGTWKRMPARTRRTQPTAPRTTGECSA